MQKMRFDGAARLCRRRDGRHNPRRIAVAQKPIFARCKHVACAAGRPTGLGMTRAAQHEHDAHGGFARPDGQQNEIVQTRRRAPKPRRPVGRIGDKHALGLRQKRMRKHCVGGRTLIAGQKTNGEFGHIAAAAGRADFAAGNVQTAAAQRVTKRLARRRRASCNPNALFLNLIHRHVPLRHFRPGCIISDKIAGIAWGRIRRSKFGRRRAYAPQIGRKTDVLKPMPIVFGRIAVYARRRADRRGALCDNRARWQIFNAAKRTGGNLFSKFG